MNISQLTLTGFVATMMLAGVSHAETRTAASASYADVSAAVSAAGSGDTVMVPAGSATWNSCLTITRGIILQGAGSDKTVITGDIDDRFGGVVKYAPTSPALNEPFRLTGFTLDARLKSNGIYLSNRTAQIINKVRIDHNRIINPGGPAAGRAIYVSGTVYGVVDNNVIDKGIALGSYGVDRVSWANLTRDFGDGNNIYFEDNTITGPDFGFQAGQGGRYVSRYNNFAGATGNLFPVFDMHGNQLGKLHSTMVAEIYGNRIDIGPYGGVFVGQRGGQALVFWNKILAGPSLSSAVVEEYDDGLDGESYVQHVTNSYYWHNRRNGTELVSATYRMYASGTATGGGDDYLEDSRGRLAGLGDGRYGLIIYGGSGAGQTRQVIAATATRLTVASKWTTNPDATSQYRVIMDPHGVLAENREFYNQNPPFDGTTGIGAGPLANRPATCTPGVAYWATDQDCTTVSDANVGAHPAVRIQGTLYKCTAPNTWTAYYTPYAYPHPLRLSGPVADVPGRATTPAGPSAGPTKP